MKVRRRLKLGPGHELQNKTFFIVFADGAGVGVCGDVQRDALRARSLRRDSQRTQALVEHSEGIHAATGIGSAAGRERCEFRSDAENGHRYAANQRRSIALCT